MKHIHLLFVALVVILYVARFWATQYKPELLENKWIKIAPHALAGLLLLSGFGLAFADGWFDQSYSWIIAKLFAMFAFIGLGMVSLKAQGDNRWYAFAGALIVLVYIVKVAFTKQAFFFLG